MSRYQSKSYLTFIAVLICLLSTFSTSYADNHAIESSMMEGPNSNNGIHPENVPVTKERDMLLPSSSTSSSINGIETRKTRSLKATLQGIIDKIKKCTIVISFSQGPTRAPSEPPSMQPTISAKPSSKPSVRPSNSPTTSHKPTSKPSAHPTNTPTVSHRPSAKPSARPTKKPQKPLSITIIINGKENDEN